MSDQLSRRQFARLLAATTAAAALPHHGSGQSAPPGKPRSFPSGFLWGSATASYQVEGAAQVGGRGATIWDTFSHTAGNTANGDTGDVADDFYHLYPKDIALMRDLGLKTFRFSVAWSRIFPTGSGTPNAEGMAFYHRMIDGLLASGIEPYCTLYHWDLPQALQDNGGWDNPDTARRFAEYAGYTAGQLSDRVSHFMTMNEIRSFTELGYQQGIHAPGLKLDKARVAQLTHHAVLGHGLAVQSIRAHARAGTQVGIADNAEATCPVLDTPEHIHAAAIAMREQNAQYLTVIQEGRYTDAYLRKLGAAAPKFTPQEMKIIASPMDFVGLNVYQPTWIRAAGNELGYEVVSPPASYPHMLSPWLYVGPEALYWSPKLVHALWNVKTLYISENGASSADVLTPQGAVLDTDRTMYLRNYIGQLQRAIEEGVPVKGYFLWSLLDNYEWADGYAKRFGIIYVDFKTQQRTLKLSASFYKDLIARNALI